MTKASNLPSRSYSMRIVSGEVGKNEGIDKSRTLTAVLSEDLVIEAVIDVDFLPAEPKQGVFYHLPDGSMWIYSGDNWVKTSIDPEAVEEEVQAALQAAKDYTDSRGFITNAVDNLINYYDKTVTYTKAEVNEIVATIEKITIRVVEALPETGEPNVIYLVPKAPGASDVYDEYIYIENRWEKIGNTEIDLTDYAKKEWVEDQIKDFPTEAETDAKLATKEDKVAPGTTGQFYRGDKTWQTLNKAAVGLSDVDNTSDAVKKLNFTGEVAEGNEKFVKGGDVFEALAEKQDTLTAGDNITIEDNVISATVEEVAWGNIAGDIADQIDLKEVLDAKADAGDVYDFVVTSFGDAPAPEQAKKAYLNSATGEWAYAHQDGQVTASVPSVTDPYNSISLRTPSPYDFDHAYVITKYMEEQGIPLGDSHTMEPTALTEAGLPDHNNWLLDGVYEIPNIDTFFLFNCHTAPAPDSFRFNFTVLDNRLYYWEKLSAGKVLLRGSGTNSVQMLSCTAGNDYALALGYNTQALGKYAFAEGTGTIANAYGAHAEGNNTEVTKNYAHVQGRHNIRDAAGTYAHIVGNGLSPTQLSNAHTLDWDGNSWYKGAIRIGGNSWSEGTPVLSEADIVDNLTSTSATDVLSAKQGKALKDVIDTKASASDVYDKTEAEAAIATAVAGEADLREAEDAVLQGQIDAITAASDVVDVVDTKADLDAYDTTKLHDNDIVKVLEDETHNNAISYYRWGATAGAFTYIGSQGPFYTKAEADILLNAKADKSTVYTKTEVDTALAGKANVGASYTKAEEDAKLALKADQSSTYSKAEADVALAGKQDKLTAGNGIVIGTNNTITFDPDTLSTVDYVDGSISDTLAYIDQQDNSEHAGRVAGDNLINAKIDARVPAPTAADADKFLKGDGTWAEAGGGAAWGEITGTLADQTDLKTILDTKAVIQVTNVDPGEGVEITENTFIAVY